MPIHEYFCKDCDRIWEDLTLKVSDVSEKIKCPLCKKKISKIMSRPVIRMGPIFTAGGLSIHDSDGHESLGMTGEQADASEKQQRDLQQHLKKGGDPMSFAIKESPQYEREE